MNKLDRAKKIELLKAIAEGKISKESLQPAKTYVFVTSNLTPGIYTMNGKQYNEAQYKKVCDEIMKKNASNIIWNEAKTFGIEEDNIITVEVCKNQNQINEVSN